MDADERDKRGRLLTRWWDVGDMLTGALEAGDFYERVAHEAQVAADIARATKGERGGAKEPLDLRPVGEVYEPNYLTHPLPPRAALLKHGGKPFLVQGKVGLLLAPGGSGKTWAFTQLAVAVATGGKWFGTYEATKGRVLLALGEEDAEEVQRRLYDVATGLGLSEYERAEVGRNVTALGLSGKSVAFIEKSAVGALKPSPWFAELRTALEAGGPWRCILLDPWSRWGGPDVEKDNHAATRGVELLEELSKLPGSPTVLVAHHTRKSAKEDATSGADADASRGASALVDGARWVVNLVRTKSQTGDKRVLRFDVTKRNHTAASEPLELVHGEGGALRPLTPTEKATKSETPIASETKAAEKTQAKGSNGATPSKERVRT